MESAVFKEYYSRLSKEAWIKSFLCGLIVGFTALLISAAVLWFTGSKLWGLALIILVVVTGGATPTFYYAKFRPSKKELARRIDDLGLEERVLTMQQLEGDDSFIAKLQREDALKTLEKFNAGLLKFVIPAALTIMLSVAGVVGLGMTTISALSSYGVIGSGSQVIGGNPNVVTYEVTYEVEGGGEIEGDSFQLIVEGENALPVLAVPEDGWVFVEWSDKKANPRRVDEAVKENFTVTAVFAEIEDGDDEDLDETGEEAGQQPGEPGDDPAPGDEAGGKYEEVNQVFDGNTYYGGEVFDTAHEEMTEEVTQNQDISKEEKDIIGDYFDTIKK